MAKFMYIFRGGGVTAGLSPTDMQAHLNKWYAWAEALAKAGRHQGGQPLENGGKTVRGYDRVVTDGPFAESKDLVTGSLVLEAASLEEATELARDCPVFEFGGSVEVRPILLAHNE
ncbi:MAG TPA: YciI family protein [Haliangiales bacterium]|nr:YciI family protein [Haliangiales bacterium]